MMLLSKVGMEPGTDGGRLDSVGSEGAAAESETDANVTLLPASTRAGSFIFRPCAAATAHLLLRQSPSLRASMTLTGALLGSETAEQNERIVTIKLKRKDRLH